MPQYKKILIGLDLSKESSQVIDRAASIAKADGASMMLIHIIEPLTFAYGGDIPMDLSEVQDQLQKQATEELARLGKKYKIPYEDQIIQIGQPASELQRIAEEQSVDLIVVGSHGREGIALLLGSTSNSVLHGCKCDVLAVRVTPTTK